MRQLRQTLHSFTACVEAVEGARSSKAGESHAAHMFHYARPCTCAPLACNMLPLLPLPSQIALKLLEARQPLPDLEHCLRTVGAWSTVHIHNHVRMHKTYTWTCTLRINKFLVFGLWSVEGINFSLSTFL